MVALAASCNFDKSGPSTGADGGGGGGDGGPGSADAMPGPDAMPDPCEDWAPAAPFDPCEIAPDERGDDLELNQTVVYTYNTTDGTLQVNMGTASPMPCTSILGGSACVLSVASLTVGSNAILRVTGDKALVIASWGSIVIEGEVDASSYREVVDVDLVEFDGPGANPESCPDLTGTDNLTGSGGGGGGGLATPGGAGGIAGGVVMTSTDGGAAVADIGLRGGCPGGDSGALELNGARADGGSGGGAIALSAFDSVSVNGSAVIQAGGAGGLRGTDEGDAGLGGAGGGSGGLVWLDAPTITLGASTTLAANGGGGGGGGDNNQNGQNGLDARSDTSPAGGGSGNDAGSGGAGVDGNDTEGGEGGTSNATGGGGGGGGGGGLIRLDGDVNDDGATITPEN